MSLRGFSLRHVTHWQIIINITRFMLEARFYLASFVQSLFIQLFIYLLIYLIYLFMEGKGLSNVLARVRFLLSDVCLLILFFFVFSRVLFLLLLDFFCFVWLCDDVHGDYCNFRRLVLFR